MSNQYAQRDHRALGEHYLRHVSAMTGEGLHAKSDIAAELAWRDQEIERLRQHVAEAVAAERERWRPVLDAVVRELACKGERRGNAPGHAHSIPGVWDSDNGPIAGTPCSWCAAWKIARELLAADAIRARAEKEGT